MLGRVDAIQQNTQYSTTQYNVASIQMVNSLLFLCCVSLFPIFRKNLGKKGIKTKI